MRSLFGVKKLFGLLILKSYHQPEDVQRDNPTTYDKPGGSTQPDGVMTQADPLVSKEYLAIFEKLSRKICIETSNIDFHVREIPRF